MGKSSHQLSPYGTHTPYSLCYSTQISDFNYSAKSAPSLRSIAICCVESPMGCDTLLASSPEGCEAAGTRSSCQQPFFSKIYLFWESTVVILSTGCQFVGRRY